MAPDAGQWTVVEIGDATQVGGARRVAARLAEAAALAPVQAGQLGLAVVELATNLFKHATRGVLFLRAAHAGVDVVAIDHGPGMDLVQCFSDGFSTGGTSGTGLGAVRRVASLFDAYSDPLGSVLYARIGPPPGVRHGTIAVPVDGELESGDAWQLVGTREGWSLLVVDGLGHGPGAAAAARPVLAAHADFPHEPARCLGEAHRRGHGTRGAACAVVSCDQEGQRLLHAGVGNIAATIVTAEGHRGLASQNGTVGVTCPTVREHRTGLPAWGLLVVHSDGLTARWSLDDRPSLRTRHPQVVAGVLFRDARRQRDDATVVVVDLGTER